MSAIIFDTETTDTKNPEIIEAAWLRVDDPRTLTVTEEYCARFRPEGRIALGALATHHIMDEDLVDCPPSASFRLPEVTYLIGHNVDFDWKAAGEPGTVRRICTLALARKYYPEADSHTLSAMLYLLDRPNAREMLRNAHSALADAYTCRRVLARMLADRLPPVQTFEDLWRLSEDARVPTVIPFGKYKGTPIKSLPRDYVEWLLRRPDLDPYLRQALLSA